MSSYKSLCDKVKQSPMRAAKSIMHFQKSKSDFQHASSLKCGKHTDLGSMFALSGFSASSDNFTSSSPYSILSINCLPVLLHHLEDRHKFNKQLPFLFCLFVPVVWRNTPCRHSFGNEQFEKLPYHLSWLFWLAACWLLSLQHLQAGAVIENWFLSKEYLFMQNSSLFFH